MSLEPTPPTARPSPAGWRKPLRLALRFGFPLVGIVVIARAIVISIGGYIEPAQFALGLVLILMTLTARLVPKR